MRCRYPSQGRKHGWWIETIMVFLLSWGVPTGSRRLHTGYKQTFSAATAAAAPDGSGAAGRRCSRAPLGLSAMISGAFRRDWDRVREHFGQAGPHAILACLRAPGLQAAAAYRPGGR